MSASNRLGWDDQEAQEREGLIMSSTGAGGERCADWGLHLSKAEVQCLFALFHESSIP